MDLFKLLHGFVKVVLCISCSLPNKTKLKFEQDFKAFWCFCFQLKVLNDSKYSMPWVRCALAMFTFHFDFRWADLQMPFLCILSIPLLCVLNTFSCYLFALQRWQQLRMSDGDNVGARTLNARISRRLFFCPRLPFLTTDLISSPQILWLWDFTNISSPDHHLRLVTARTRQWHVRRYVRCIQTFKNILRLFSFPGFERVPILGLISVSTAHALLSSEILRVTMSSSRR